MIRIDIRDMYKRDQELLNWLQTRGDVKTPARTIAQEFKCNPDTARAMLKRLEGGGFIEVIRKGNKGGYVYRCKEN